MGSRQGRLEPLTMQRIAAALRIDYTGPAKDMPVSGLKTLSVIADMAERLERVSRQLDAMSRDYKSLLGRVEQLERRGYTRGTGNANAHATERRDRSDHDAERSASYRQDRDRAP